MQYSPALVKLRIGFDDSDGLAGHPAFLDVNILSDGSNVIVASLPSNSWVGGRILNFCDIRIGHAGVRFQCPGRAASEFRRTVISMVDRNKITGPIREVKC